MNRDTVIVQLQQDQEKDLEILTQKSDECAQGTDTFLDYRMVEVARLISLEEGIAVRMSDKLQRTLNLLDQEQPQVEDETIADTLSDLRNYANILQVHLQKNK